MSFEETRFEKEEGLQTKIRFEVFGTRKEGIGMKGGGLEGSGRVKLGETEQVYN